MKLFTSAKSPRELSIKDWKEALNETKNALGNKNLSIFAAGIAYFSTLAFFPLLAAGVAIAAFIIDTHQVEAIIRSMSDYLPSDVANLVGTQLKNLSKNDGGSLLYAIIAILISLFSASSATENLITATNTAYSVKETRGFIKMKLISFILTLGALAMAFILAPILVVTPDFLVRIGVPSFIANTLVVVRWILALIIISIALAAFYRYGPNRKNPRWQWVSWGATAATTIWLIGTALFFLYVQNFAKFNESFGVFAGIIILMSWLNLSALIFLIGAEVNHRLENKAK
jgi:membrane protein